jgi:hypothetical protein
VYVREGILLSFSVPCLRVGHVTAGSVRFPCRRSAVSQYIHVGILLISVPNVIVIGLMLVVFGLALVLKLPHQLGQ